MTGSEAEGIHRFRWEHRLSKNFRKSSVPPSRAMPSQSTALRRRVLAARSAFRSAPA